MKITRRNHGAAFITTVTVATLKGDKTLAEVAEHFGVHPTRITEWKQPLLARASDVFSGTSTSRTRLISIASTSRSATDTGE